MSRKKIAVIGGGAAGIAAAITAAEQGADVTIYEGNDRIGKKILATGNGKCNLSNLHMSAECFQTSDPDKLRSCLAEFGVQETIAFFQRLGLLIREKNGYLYPMCEQAAVVLDVLRIGVAKQGIHIHTETKIQDIKPAGRQLQVSWKQGQERFDKVILACGSKAAPKTGSDGSGYELAKRLGHRIIPVVPSLVQLKCKDSFCKSLAGIRAECCIHIYEGNRELCRESGEIQLTDYGISGIPVFQLSALVNRRLLDKKHTEITAKVDFLPGYTKKEFQQLVQERLSHVQDQACSNTTVEEFFTGILNKKLMILFMKSAGLNPLDRVNSVPDTRLKMVFDYCKALEYHIVGHNGFENAQVCSGGVDMQEVTEYLESKKVPGVFFAGELLDVDGRCGGYNLQWAWTSGVIAGKGAMND